MTSTTQTQIVARLPLPNMGHERAYFGVGPEPLLYHWLSLSSTILKQEKSVTS